MQFKSNQFLQRSILKNTPQHALNVRSLSISLDSRFRLPLYLSMRGLSLDKCETESLDREIESSKREILVPQATEIATNPKEKVILDHLGRPHLVRDALYSFSTKS